MRGGASQEAGGSRAAVGAVGPAAMQWGGVGPAQARKDEGSPPAALLWRESLWWAGQCPLVLGLLPLGDERLSLPWLGVGAGVTEAALYPLGAGAVTWTRGEDIIGAWRGGLLGPHHNAPIVILILLGHSGWVPAQPQDFALQLLVYQVYRLR